MVIKKPSLINMFVLLSTGTWIRIGIFGLIIIGSLVYRLYSKSKAKEFNSRKQARVSWRRLPLNTDIGPYKKWEKSDKRLIRIVDEGIYFGGTLIPFDQIEQATHYRPSNRTLVNELVSTLRIQTDREIYDILAPYQLITQLRPMINIREETLDIFFGKYRKLAIGFIIIIVIIYAVIKSIGE